MVGDTMNLERLLYLREEKELTQKDIAKLLNVSRVAISHWETTKEIIPLKKLNDYCNYFKVSMDYIIYLEKYKKYNNHQTTLNSILIGKRIKEVRKKNNLTQEKLAKELNTTHSTISAYESGKTTIITTFAYQICKNYNVSMDWLCGRK